MASPTFAGFSLQDENFITERITFKGYADRELVSGKIARREGINLMNTEFGAKEIQIEGRVIASTASELQSLLDNLKKNLTTQEGDLIIETARTFKATVRDVSIPDEHYNQTTVPFEITFLCSNPFSEGTQLSAVTPVISGTFTFSGLVNISGSLFARPSITYTPPSDTGETLIVRIDILHTSTGQAITVSGLGSPNSLLYQNEVIVNFDEFTALDGTTERNTGGSFPKWEPGNNNYTFTVSGRAFPGGQIAFTYKPRYL